MLWVASTLKGYSIAATDGEIGTVSDLLFDDTTWRLRWLVVDTGNWLPGRLVLLHPSVLGRPDAEARSVPVLLTRAKVEASPDIQQDLPVSRQMEQGVFAHYGWDPYWGGGAFGMNALAPTFVPPGVFSDPADPDSLLEVVPEGDPHLRSVFATTGYHIQATDGEIGHASDFIIADGSWMLRYMIVDTRNWWPGKHVLISPLAVTNIDWADQKISVNVSMEKVKASPEWDPSKLADESYDQHLRGYYNWPGSDT